jgi:tetratricopeptide (TPR) repeat protein
MKTCLIFLGVLILIFGLNTIQSQTVDEYIKKAGQLQKSGDIDQAIEVMSKAVEKFPQSAIAYSYFGLFTGMKAGKTKDYMEAFKYVNESFQRLDKAISLEARNPTVRLHRGIMGISIPEFLGKLDLGISDLEFNIRMEKESPGTLSKDVLLTTYQYLAQGYQKKKETQKAISAWKEIIKIAPGSDLAKKAAENIKKLSAIEPDKTTEK